MKQQINTRNLILDILLEINENNGFTHMVLSDALSKYQYLPMQDRAFISRVVRGTVERKITLDYIINRYSSIKINKMKPIIRNILRMSVYQIMFMEGVKDYAACDEAVKITIKRRFNNLKGFVNAVLRKISAEKWDIAYPDEADAIKYLSVVYSTPEWLVAKWLQDYDRDTVEGMLSSQFADRMLTIRCNTVRITRDELSERLMSQGITVRKSNLLPEALEIADYDYLEKIPEFNEGFFFVQDLSSMLVSHIAAAKSNSYVIDLCAAPGGKSMHMAELLKGTGCVEARDVSENKVQLIRNNIDRLELENVAATVKDATQKDDMSVGKADVVIADLPCSGLGIISKKPDIKYHATPENVIALSNLQKSILKASADYVKSGGTLVYSTCTVTKEENDNNVQWFLDNFPYKLDSIDEYIPDELKSDTTSMGYLQLLPGVIKNTESGKDELLEGYDGFFIARFLRK